MENLFLLLEDTANPNTTWITIAMLVGMLLIFYFIAIRPQKKQQKQIDDMRSNLQIGDEITTIGGIIGKIVSIKDETCVIETGRDGFRMRILKSAVRCVDVPANVANYTISVDEKAADDAANENDIPENTESNEAKGNKKDKKKKK